MIPLWKCVWIAFFLFTIVLGNELGLNNFANEDLTKDGAVFCRTCVFGINEIMSLNDTDAMINKLINLCMTLGFGEEYVCSNLVFANADEMIYIISNSPDTDAEDFCGFVFVGEGCVTNNPDRVWEVTLPDVPKPPIDQTPYPQDVLTLKVLHLSDTHYDPDYAPGGVVDCVEEYLCCRTFDESALPNNTADFWGTYGSCDVPKWTLEAMYEHITVTYPDIDFIIWTGDLVPHNVWNTSREETLMILHEMTDLILRYFPGIPVYPAVGNHDSDPASLFPQPYIKEPEFEISWLYDELNVLWQNWLPIEVASSVLYSAYYSVPVLPGLKLISLNTNYCYGYNWWLLLDSTDIANELELLAGELQKSENEGELVYIIGHIPPGHNDCSLTWSHQFNKIVARYESTISGMFYGHTHHDHFQLFFDPEDPNRPSKVAYIGQSQSTYSNSNPGYKVYTIEAEFEGTKFRVLDHENWIFNLTASNAANESTVVYLYSAKEAYGLEDFSPESWLDLIIEMNHENSSLFEDFYVYYTKASPPKLEDGCDDDCKQDILCRLVTSDNSDPSKCDLYIKNATLQ